MEEKVKKGNVNKNTNINENITLALKEM